MREPLFVVAAPRSYTSVIGGMLGQHPQTYGLPEVNLSHAATLGEMWNTVMTQIGLGTSGLLRVLAQLHEGEQTEAGVRRAQTWIATHSDWTGAQVFRHLQDQVGPHRIIVDKSPRNAFKIENLRRLLEMYPRANFLHLVRHPRSQCNSAVSLMQNHGGGRRKADPEPTWLSSQSNAVEFFQALAPGQHARIQGEALLRNPRFYLAQICEWLDIDTGAEAIEAMLHPENSPFASIGPPSAMYGADPNFLNAPTLDFERLGKIRDASLDGELEWKPPQTFDPAVRRLALQFGYS